MASLILSNSAFGSIIKSLILLPLLAVLLVSRVTLKTRLADDILIGK